MICPNCKKKMEEHGINAGDFHWWLCIGCGFIVDDESEVNK